MEDSFDMPCDQEPAGDEQYYLPGVGFLSDRAARILIAVAVYTSMYILAVIVSVIISSVTIKVIECL